MNDETQKFDDSPQAQFVKSQLRKEFPEKSDEEIETMWRERLRRVIEQEGGEDACYTCGS